MMEKLKRIATQFLAFLQRIKLYRIAAKKLMRKQVHYRIATDEDAPVLYRFQKHDVATETGGSVKAYAKSLGRLASTNIGYALIAYLGEKVVGTLVVRRHPGSEKLYPDWWVYDLMVDMRYRGLGIGESLMNKALQKAAEQGAKRVSLLVFESNKAAIKLYRKMGFQQISIPELDAQLEEAARQGKGRRIIMSLHKDSPIMQTTFSVETSGKVC